MQNIKNFTALMRAVHGYRVGAYHSKKLDLRTGICANLANFDVVVDWPKFHAAIRKWPEFTGSIVNPVPHIKGVGYWDGRNGELRQNLLKFLIVQQYEFLMSDAEVADIQIEDEMLSAVGGE